MRHILYICTFSSFSQPSEVSLSTQFVPENMTEGLGNGRDSYFIILNSTKKNEFQACPKNTISLLRIALSNTSTVIHSFFKKIIEL